MYGKILLIIAKKKQETQIMMKWHSKWVWTGGKQFMDGLQGKFNYCSSYNSIKWSHNAGKCIRVWTSEKTFKICSKVFFFS